MSASVCDPPALFCDPPAPYYFLPALYCDLLLLQCDPIPEVYYSLSLDCDSLPPSFDAVASSCDLLYYLCELIALAREDRNIARCFYRLKDVFPKSANDFRKSGRTKRSVYIISDCDLTGKRDLLFMNLPPHKNFVTERNSKKYFLRSKFCLSFFYFQKK